MQEHNTARKCGPTHWIMFLPQPWRWIPDHVAHWISCKLIMTKKLPKNQPKQPQANKETPKLKVINVTFTWIDDLCCLVVMLMQGRWLETVEHVASFGLGTALNWLKQNMKLHLYLYVQHKLFKEGAVFLSNVCSACGSWPPNTTNVPQLQYYMVFLT